MLLFYTKLRTNSTLKLSELRLQSSSTVFWCRLSLLKDYCNFPYVLSIIV